MARKCKITNPKLAELREALKAFVTTVEPGSKDYDDKLLGIRLAYMGLGGPITEEQFQQALSEANITASVVEPVKVGTVTQLQNPSLDYKNLSTIYRNATSALGYMRHDFNVRMFSALFIDNKNYGQEKTKFGLVNDTIKRVPITQGDVNKNIANVKNKLIQTVCDKFGINLPEPVFKFVGSKSKVNEQLYHDIMNNPQVLNWLATVGKNLATADTEVQKIHSALFILNNFDELVKQFLPKIAKNSKLSGLVSNMQYIRETEGNAPSMWSVDDLATYGSDLYASNLGKFILSTIPKVDSSLNPIEGAYMTSQDAFVLASLLREAEMEYHVLARDTDGYPYNPELSLHVNLTEAAKVLMKMGLNDELDSLSRFKKEIFPVYHWLYESDDKTIGIQQIYREAYKKGQIPNVTQILNLEHVLTNEIVKNVSPVYIENTTFNTNGYKAPVRTINVAHTFRGTSYITQNVQSAVLDELKLDVGQQNKFLNRKYVKDSLKDTTIDDILQGNSEVAKEFADAFELLFGVPFDPVILQEMKIGSGKAEDAFPYVKDIVCKIGELFVGATSKPIDEQETYFIDAFTQTFLKRGSDLYNKYTNLVQTIADRKTDTPITIIRNAEGKAIPIYRLGSTIFEDAYLMNQLKKNQTNRDCRNLFIANPHLLSPFNNRGTNAGEVIPRNNAYKGSTGLRLETISEQGVNSANDSSGKESYINSFFGDFIGLGLDEAGHTISVQLMTLSDKASILTKIVNLAATIKGYGVEGNGFVELNKSLDAMTNQEIERLYYYYRKNQVVDEVFHIIDTWNKVLSMNLVMPDINRELANTGEMLPETRVFIETNWKQVKNRLNEMNIKSAEDVEMQLRHVNTRLNLSIDLVKDLHYSFYKGELALNKNIYYHFLQVSTKRNFDGQISRYIGMNINHPWYATLNKLAKSDKGKELITKYCVMHNLVPSPDGIPVEVLKRKIMLDGLIRSQVMDFHFKGPQLDAIKNMPNYDEQDEANINQAILEADSKFKAGGKRTVDLPGTKQNFAQGLIDGVSEEVLVAHIQEPTEEVFNPMGQSDKCEIFNGAGRISPIYAMMESASNTGEPFRGVNRKTLGQHVGDYSSTLYKWAEYTINNWHMRNSMRSKYHLLDLFEKMHNLDFDDDINLTKSFVNPDQRFTPQKANLGKPVYFSNGLHYYQILDMTYKGDNMYDFKIIEVNEYGEELVDQPVLDWASDYEISNLFDLFTALGGTESMQKGENGKLEYSDDSLTMLYNYVVNVGEIIDENYDEFNQKTVRQPLREKFVAIAASDSGIKRGVTNLNSKKAYTDNRELLVSKIRTALFGKQMDAYHHIDEDSTATEPTQTLAALATNGNTRAEANQVYEAIASIIRSNMKAVARASSIEYNEANAERVLTDLTKDIVNIINDSGSDIQNSIVEMCQTYLGGIIPVSDQTFYTAFHSYNIQQLNQLALRRKYAGLGGVLNPSSNVYQMFTFGKKQYDYDDVVRMARKRFEEYSDVLNEYTTEELVDLYLFSQSDEGKKMVTSVVTGKPIFYLNSLFERVYQQDQSAVDELNKIQSWTRQIAEYFGTNPNGTISKEAFEASVFTAGHKIQKGEADPLDAVFYIKNGKYYHAVLDTAEKYFNFVNDPEITEAWLDLFTPTDLKPQIIKYDYNGTTHSLYDSDAGEMSYLLNSMSDADFSEALEDMIEEGTQVEQSCKL